MGGKGGHGWLTDAEKEALRAQVAADAAEVAGPLEVVAAPGECHSAGAVPLPLGETAEVPHVPAPLAPPARPVRGRWWRAAWAALRGRF